MSADPTNVSAGLSGRYALALYSLADERRELDAVVADMATLGRLIGESAPLRAVLGSPILDARQAGAAVLAVAGQQKIGRTVRDFVGVVAANRRLAALPRLVAGFAALVAARRGVVVADVATAHPLTDTQRAQLRARLAELGYGNVDLAETTDPALLGGLVLKIGSRLYDTSLKSRLQRLQHAMKEAA